MLLIEKLKVLSSVKFAWRSKSTMAEAIRGFQATEADGVWHLHAGLQRLTDPKERATVFLHGLEEESHADEFAAVYKHYGEHVFSAVHYEREPLYGPDEPLWKTFAYVHVGEHDATERFRLLREALAESPLKHSLAKVVEDESGHVDLTRQMLLALGATDGAIRVELLKIRARRLWENWLRIGRRWVDFVGTLLLSAVYYAAGPFVARAARKRLSERVVEFDNSYVKRG